MRGQRTKTNARTRKGKAKTVANKKKVRTQRHGGCVGHSAHSDTDAQRLLSLRPATASFLAQAGFIQLSPAGHQVSGLCRDRTASLAACPAAAAQQQEQRQSRRLEQQHCFGGKDSRL